jgi:hypothetical protein
MFDNLPALFWGCLFASSISFVYPLCILCAFLSFFRYALSFFIGLYFTGFPSPLLFFSIVVFNDDEY